MELIDEGFRLFTQETFGGNGRTCATCHVPSEAYNIFPQTISSLSARDRRLVFVPHVPGLENADLIRSHALFNISGGPAPLCLATNGECFHDEDGHAGPVFRSAMTVQALDLTTEIAGGEGTPLLPEECSAGVEDDLPQLGWAGDGSPGTPKDVDDALTPDVDEAVDCHVHHGTFDVAADGSIRAFANGAIAQHNTRSLARIAGVDFRLANDTELDALEALQRWLGRRPLTDEENALQETVDATEFDIERLEFHDPRVAKGRDHYVGDARCDACHNNGGGVGFGSNNNLDTFVENASPQIGLDIVGAALPHDEGAFITALGGAGLGGFNIQSVIESAEKKAWFHNHKVVGDFEEAIAHYGSDDFLDGTGGGFPAPRGGLEGLRNGDPGGSDNVFFAAGDGIEHLGTFLRALNAFYNLRDCERLIDEAIARINIGVSVGNPVRHCEFNLDDVGRVLRQAKHEELYPGVQLGAVVARVGLNGVQPGNRYASQNVRRLEVVKTLVRGMRDAIATQIPPPTP
jgi:hypothetical protein